LNLDECTKIKVLIDRRNSLRERADKYKAAVSMSDNKLAEIIKADEEHTAHQERAMIFVKYSAFATKQAANRKQYIYNDMNLKVRNQFVTKDLEKDYNEYSVLCSKLKSDVI
jgi:hypothetical protein